MSTSSNELAHEEGALKAIADSVEKAKGEFNNHAKTLDSQILGIQAKWQGEGGRAFFRLHQNWTERQAKIVGALDNFSNALIATQKTNVDTDQQAGARLGRLSDRLG